MSSIYRVFFISFLVLLSTQSIFAGRYYDSATGRWLSVDPKSDKYPGWSPYNYCLNNPLINVDPDGREVKIYSRWSGPGHRHLFIIVQNKNTGIFTSRSLMPAGGPLEGLITALPFVKGSGTPEIRTDMESELDAVKRQQAGEKDVDAHMEMLVSPPSGMSEEEYDKVVLDAADKYPVEDRPYDADDGPNSNTYVDDVIESTGVKLPQFNNATQQKWSDEQKKKKEN